MCVFINFMLLILIEISVESCCRELIKPLDAERKIHVFMPNQSPQYHTHVLGPFKFTMKLLSVIKRWFKVSHL